MVKPTFIYNSVHKSGTTSLINYLSQHPKIFMKQNEMHFFDRPKNIELTTHDIDEYENSFDTNKPIIGKKTPSYNYLYFSIDRISRYNSNIKLILLLREPIQRAYSQYNMIVTNNNQTLNDISDEQIVRDFEQEENLSLSKLTNNGMYYIIRGKYDEIITNILGKFSSDNIYIGIAEEI